MANCLRGWWSGQYERYNGIEWLVVQHYSAHRLCLPIRHYWRVWRHTSTEAWYISLVYLPIRLSATTIYSAVRRLNGLVVCHNVNVRFLISIALFTIRNESLLLAVQLLSNCKTMHLIKQRNRANSFNFIEVKGKNLLVEMTSFITWLPKHSKRWEVSIVT